MTLLHPPILETLALHWPDEAACAAFAQRLAGRVPEILAKPDVMGRLEELQTLPRTPNVLGDPFVSLVRSQIDDWRTVARASNVEVIT